MLAASPAGMPAVLALPCGITVATAWPAGAWPRGRFAGGRLMTEALVLWRAGPVCRSRRVPLAGRGAWPPGPGFAGAAGEAHLTVSGSAVTRPDERSRATAPGRAVFWILAGRYRLCLTTSC